MTAESIKAENVKPVEERDVTREDVPSELPLIPIKDMIVYPYAMIPLVVKEGRSLKAIEEAMTSKRLIFAVALKPDASDTEDHYDIGTVCSIEKMMKMPDGSVRLILQGIYKAALLDRLQGEPFPKARIRILEETYEEGTELEALTRTVADRARRLISLGSQIPDELLPEMDMDNPLAVVYLHAILVNIDVEERQQILEVPDVKEKLRKLLDFVSKEVEVKEISDRIKSQVENDMSKTQKEYYLRKQMEAIKKELGEGDGEGAEVKELKEKIEGKKLPEEVRTQAEKELARLERIPSTSPEYSVITGYLDWIVELPWKESTEDKMDLDRSQEILDEDHYDLERIKERIVEYLAVLKLKKNMKAPILCFVGPPGTGKTSLGKSVARALGRKFIRFSLGGVKDEAEIRGHRRTYIGAMPGVIVQHIRRAGSNNPVMMLDEVDKVGADFRGDPSSALLEVLDPEQNSAFRDHYLDLSFDLSRVMFICTANVLDTIHPALRDRMEILRLSGYTTQEKTFIARKYLIPRQIEEHGIGDIDLEITDKALLKIIDSYTREAGVRNLEREIASVCRKVARKTAQNGAKEIKADEDDLYEFLGKQKFFPETSKRTSRAGVATGLAWTQSGGDIIFVEAIKMAGKKGLTITGQLGEVMQESAKAALSFVRSQADRLELSEDFYENYDLHIHIPAGAIPKDGPSAGVTLAAAIASIFTKRPVKSDVAMTGEITLSGQVLPVGGIKEKVLAAKRAGIKTVILPDKNRKDVDEISSELIEDIEFKYVEGIDDVFDIVLS